MKKLFFLLLIICIITPAFIFADVHDDEDMYTNEYEYEDDVFKDTSKRLRIKDRTHEVGFSAGFNFSNDLFTVSNIFSDTIVLDIDKLSSGFNMNLGIYATPFYYNFNNNNEWGFGISLFNTEVNGSLSASGKMLSLDKAENSISEANAAVYTEIGFSGFFHVNDLKISVKPALFFPIVYINSDISYTYITNKDETILDIDYVTYLYTAFALENGSGLTATPGFNITAGFEYPLSKILDLEEVHHLLDFDLGLDLINIPIVPAVMKDYKVMSGNIKAEGKTIDEFFDSFDNDSNENETYTDGNKSVNRPFKMIIWAGWRPLGTDFLTLIPSLGFCIDPIYMNPVSMEYGIKARIDFLNMLIATAGITHDDRVFINSLDLALNLRAFEFNLGLSLQSNDFLKSWDASGFGISVGMKFGW